MVSPEGAAEGKGECLGIGRVLPALPLRLDDTALPLDLEASYTEACRALRI